MLLKLNGQYLDFNDDVTIERMVKIFEEIDATQGDFSYSFSLPPTSKNLAALGHPHPDVSSKIIYSDMEAELLDSEGSTIYKGGLKVEVVNKKEIKCSFISGNSNWISLLTGNMTELRLHQYNVEQNSANIIASWSNTSGIVFPWLDTGTLLTRGYISANVEDFVGAFYVKTLFKEVFTQIGIKLKGDFFNDWTFNNLLMLTNTRSKVDKENNSAYIAKSTNQTIEPGSEDITFNETTTPYSVGSDLTLTSSTTITVPYAMIADLSASLSCTDTLGMSIFLDGVTVAFDFKFQEPNASVRNLYIPSGGQIKVTVVNGTGGNVTVSAGKLRVTPKFIYAAFGRSCVPLWTKQEFVGRILSLFNAVTDYNPHTKTLTVDLFDKIKTKTPIDISEYITVEDEDYTEFISNYGRNNNFTYSENDDESVQEYNISSFIKYGAGVVTVDNSFIQESASVVDSEISAPVSYYNSMFNQSIEKVDYVSIEEIDSLDFTSITDSGGVPRFNITDADQLFEDGGFVRISDSTTLGYNGDWVVTAVTSTYITVRGLDFISGSAAATGTVAKIQQVVNSDDSVYLLLNTGEKPVSDFSDRSGFYLEDVFDNNWNFSYFNLLQLGYDIEEDYKQGLSFGGGETQAYQKTLLETYWRNFGSILSDPVKLKCTALFPKSVFLRLTPLTPVYLKTEQTTNLYYINRITGYQESHLPCEVELIKL
jgi:hypothetical protein